MKAIYLGLTLGPAMAPLAAGAELRRLSEVIAQESSATTAIYVATRCAGFFSAISFRATQSGREDVQEIVDRVNNASGQFLMIAATVAKNPGLNQDLPCLVEQTAKITTLYDAEMSANFLAEGNANGDRTAADATICREILAAH